MIEFTDIRPSAWIARYGTEKFLTWDKPSTFYDQSPKPLFTLEDMNKAYGQGKVDAMWDEVERGR